MAANTNLSEAAQTAVINTTPRQGAKPAGPLVVTSELQHAGIIGTSLGLTRRGLITRARLVEAKEREAFGG